MGGVNSGGDRTTPCNTLDAGDSAAAATASPIAVSAITSRGSHTPMQLNCAQFGPLGTGLGCLGTVVQGLISGTRLTFATLFFLLFIKVL